MNHRKWRDSLSSRLEDENAELLLDGLAETFRVLRDPTRVRILMVLVKEETCVRDLAENLGMSDSAVSHQLRILRSSRLVKYRKEGKNVLYSIGDDHVGTIFKEGFEHVEAL